MSDVGQVVALKKLRSARQRQVNPLGLIDQEGRLDHIRCDNFDGGDDTAVCLGQSDRQ